VIAVSAKWFPGCCRVRQMVAWGRCQDLVAVGLACRRAGRRGRHKDKARGWCANAPREPLGSV